MPSWWKPAWFALVSLLLPAALLPAQIVVSSSLVIPPLSASVDYALGAPTLEELLDTAGYRDPDWTDDMTSLPGGVQFFQMSSLFLGLPFPGHEDAAEDSFPSGIVASVSPIVDLVNGPQFVLNYRARVGFCLNVLQTLDGGFHWRDPSILVALNAFHSKRDVTLPTDAPERVGGIIRSTRTGGGLEVSLPRYVSVELNVGYVAMELPEHVKYGGVHFGLTIRAAPYALRLPLVTDLWN